MLVIYVPHPPNTQLWSRNNITVVKKKKNQPFIKRENGETQQSLVHSSNEVPLGKN